MSNGSADVVDRKHECPYPDCCGDRVSGGDAIHCESCDRLVWRCQNRNCRNTNPSYGYYCRHCNYRGGLERTLAEYGHSAAFLTCSKCEKEYLCFEPHGAHRCSDAPVGPNRVPLPGARRGERGMRCSLSTHQGSLFVQSSNGIVHVVRTGRDQKSSEIGPPQSFAEAADRFFDPVFSGRFVAVSSPKRLWIHDLRSNRDRFEEIDLTLAASERVAGPPAVVGKYFLILVADEAARTARIVQALPPAEWNRGRSPTESTPIDLQPPFAPAVLVKPGTLFVHDQRGVHVIDLDATGQRPMLQSKRFAPLPGYRPTDRQAPVATRRGVVMAVELAEAPTKYTLLRVDPDLSMLRIIADARESLRFAVGGRNDELRFVADPFKLSIYDDSKCLAEIGMRSPAMMPLTALGEFVALISFASSGGMDERRDVSIVNGAGRVVWQARLEHVLGSPCFLLDRLYIPVLRNASAELTEFRFDSRKEVSS